MVNLNNIHLWKTPLTGRLVLGAVNSKNEVRAQRDLKEDEIRDILASLIDYMDGRGVNMMTNTETGETYLFGKETKK